MHDPEVLEVEGVDEHGRQRRMHGHGVVEGVHLQLFFGPAEARRVIGRSLAVEGPDDADGLPRRIGEQPRLGRRMIAGGHFGTGAVLAVRPEVIRAAHLVANYLAAGQVRPEMPAVGAFHVHSAGCGPVDDDLATEEIHADNLLGRHLRAECHGVPAGVEGAQFVGLRHAGRHWRPPWLSTGYCHGVISFVSSFLWNRGADSSMPVRSSSTLYCILNSEFMYEGF